MQTVIITFITLVAFAANSVLCRWALMDQTIDPLSFSIMRIISGAFTLLILLTLSSSAKRKQDKAVNNTSMYTKVRSQFDLTAIVALLVYMFGFSFAYLTLGAGLGALVLFVAVQFTMIAAHLLAGNRMSLLEWCGCLLSVSGLVYLLMPTESTSSPDITSIILMTLAGIGWGIYTLAGKKSTNALQSTTANFGFSSLAILVLVSLLLTIPSVASKISITEQGLIYAILSGSVASGVGYSLWYYVVKKLNTVVASIAQLSVPVIATLGGVLLLSEPVTMQFVISSTVILLGISLVLVAPKLKKQRVQSLTSMAKPNKKQPTKTVQIFCAKCKTQLFKYRKGGKGALVKCFKERIVEDFTKEPCVCPECGIEFARDTLVRGTPAYKFVGGKVTMK